MVQIHKKTKTPGENRPADEITEFIRWKTDAE